MYIQHVILSSIFCCHDNAGANPGVAWEGAREGCNAKVGVRGTHLRIPEFSELTERRFPLSESNLIPQSNTRPSLPAMTHHHVGHFATLTFLKVLQGLVSILPREPQLRYNPFTHKTSPGYIRYAFVSTDGDLDQVVYKFAKNALPLQQPPEFVRSLASAVHKKTGIKYDVCLINLYDVPLDFKGTPLSLHMDNESIMDTTTPITSVTFTEDPGYKARFVYCKDEKSTKGDKEIFNLGHGDMFTGPLATHYHGVKKDLKPMTNKVKSRRRICITFRRLKY